MASMSGNEVEGRLGRRKRFDDSYGLVLLLLVISYFCDAVLGDYTWGRVVVVLVLAAATWLALRASQVERRPMRIAQALIPLLCVVAVASLLIGDENVAHAVTAAISAILVIVAPIAIGRHLVRKLELSFENFLGAVCIYLLVAQLFATLFALTARRRRPAVLRADQPPDDDRLHLLQLRHHDHVGLRRLHLSPERGQDAGGDGGHLRPALPHHRRGSLVVQNLRTKRRRQRRVRPASRYQPQRRVAM